MRIPYGMANFADIRREGYFYADKTRVLPMLESTEAGQRYLVLLRPRRFGKSLLVSMLRYHYDIAEAENFENLFGGLWIHDHPTEERNRYMVLHLDFSPVDASDGSALLRTSFTSVVREAVRGLAKRYRTQFPEIAGVASKVEEMQDAVSILRVLETEVQSTQNHLYIIIDEYDSLPNDLLARGETALYQDMVMDKGFMRAFYKGIKAGAQAGVIRRVFITGVTPVPLDDMASGFNISTNISLASVFNAICGFTEDEMSDAVREFLALTPELAQAETLRETLANAYDGYLFSPRAKERLFNPDMVLYYLRELRVEGGPPRNLLDLNVRTDYTKIRAIASPMGRRPERHLDYVQSILTEGGVSGELVEQFGSRNMYDERHLTSLLYFMGMLTIAGTREGMPWFGVPNRVIRTLHWEELAFLWREQAGAVVDVGRFPDAKYAYVLELKHVKKKDVVATEQGTAAEGRAAVEAGTTEGQAAVEAGAAEERAAVDAGTEDSEAPASGTSASVRSKRAEALDQLDKYLSDPLLPALLGNRTILGVSLVLVGATGLHW